MVKFRPIPYPKKYSIKARIYKKREYELKFGTWTKKHSIIEHIFEQLHYLGSHSYRTQQWKKAERRLFNTHPNRF